MFAFSSQTWTTKPHFSQKQPGEVGRVLRILLCSPLYSRLCELFFKCRCTKFFSKKNGMDGGCVTYCIDILSSTAPICCRACRKVVHRMRICSGHFQFHFFVVWLSSCRRMTCTGSLQQRKLPSGRPEAGAGASVAFFISSRIA